MRNFSGDILHNGSNPGDPYVKSGAVAVIIAPGPVLRRQGLGSSQNRGCVPGACSPTNRDVCTSSPPWNTAKCNRLNFLDRRSAAGVTEDNQDFTDGSATNGFIQGDSRDANGNVVVNDRILPITYDDIMPVLERRVAGEVLNCLQEYSLLAVPPNNGRYPWAARADDPYPNFTADIGVRFGRIPEDAPWGSNCAPLTGTNWWLNWHEHVFYAVAEAFQPAPSVGVCGPAPPGTCLAVDPSFPIADRRAVVMVAGKKLAAVLPDIPVDQVRDNATQKGIVTNYLEGENADDPPGTYDNSFTSGPATATFNDVTCNNGNCL